MGIIPIIKHAVNSTLGTGFFTPLDQLLGAKIACRGTMGTKFKLTRTDGYFPEKTVEITEASRLLGDGLYVEIVPVPLGAYSIEINVSGTIMTASVAASAIGEIYKFSYSSYQLIESFETPGTYNITIPAGVTEIFVDSAGGGGGGGGGGYAGGGGGGGAYFLVKKKYSVASNQKIEIEIGSGGSGGAEYENGKDGTATVIGSLVTLAGGLGGEKTSGHDSNLNANAGGLGGGGKTRGGNGGIGSNGSTKATRGIGGEGGKQGESGSDGTNGKSAEGVTSGNYMAPAGGGGGGGSYSYGGRGGNGNLTSSGGKGSDGNKGSGGGGGGGALGSRTHGSGGNGGNGFAEIYKGVQVI